MSLSAALQIGRSALSASQLGIQIAGNNLANAATPGYSRQVGSLEALRGDNSVPGGGAGRGVRVSAINRQVDAALQARLVSSTSEAAAANTRRQITSQVETVLGELGNNDLSSELTSFFRAWSERANQTKSAASVIQQGDKMAQYVKNLRNDLVTQRKQIDAELTAGVSQANNLINSISTLNSAISSSEGTGTPANSLRDQRDGFVAQLAELMDISVVDRGLGGIDVLVGSTPVVLGKTPKTLHVSVQSIDGQSVAKIVTTGDRGQELTIETGQMGALLESRTGTIDSTIARLDDLTSKVIFEVNKLHSTGTNAKGHTSLTSTIAFNTSNRVTPMNDPGNTALADLPFAAQNGGFLVHVKHTATGAMESIRINVDLDGVTASGLPGTTDDTSVEDIRAAIDGIEGIRASFNAEGKLSIVGDDGFEFSFSDDTSNSLAVLGVNAYFTGTNAADIAVRTDLLGDSNLLTSGRIVDGLFVENATALALARVQEQTLPGLSGQTIKQVWQDTVQFVGGAAATAKAASDSKMMVYDALQNQRDSLSGVNTDEESISLLDYQRQYQAAARIISTVDQMTQTLMSLL